MSHLLSKSEVDRYHADGYIIPTYKLDPDYLKDLQNALNTLLSEKFKALTLTKRFVN